MARDRARRKAARCCASAGDAREGLYKAWLRKGQGWDDTMQYDEQPGELVYFDDTPPGRARLRYSTILGYTRGLAHGATRRPGATGVGTMHEYHTWTTTDNPTCEQGLALWREESGLGCIRNGRRTPSGRPRVDSTPVYRRRSGPTECCSRKRVALRYEYGQVPASQWARMSLRATEWLDVSQLSVGAMDRHGSNGRRCSDVTL